jgi:hypothetical protein
MAHRIKDQLELVNQPTDLAIPGVGMAAIGVVNGRVVAKGNSGEDIPVGIGHVVSAGDGTEFPPEGKLQFSGGGVQVADDPENNATLIIINGSGDNATVAIGFTDADWDAVPSLTISATDLPFGGSRNLFVQVEDEVGRVINCGVSIENSGDVILTATAPFTGSALISGGRGEEILPGASAPAYSLANGAFRMNTNGTSATFANVTLVPLSDGWVGYQQIADAAHPLTCTAEAVEGLLHLTCKHIGRPVGTTSVQEIRIFRPLTPLETFPLRGKQVTFSVDLLAGTGFPNTSANGINFSVTGTTNVAANFTKINSSGAFTSQSSVIRDIERIYGIPTDAYERYTATFNVPENVTQICLRFTHTPLGTGSAVPADYDFYIHRPAFAIGSAPQAFIPPTLAEDRLSLADRYQRVLATFRGAVTQGQAVAEDIVFPFPFMAAPTCTYAANESAPAAFPATPAKSDMASITTYSALLTRTATADSDSGLFRVFYGFTVPLW